MTQTILVTGALGNIGSFATQELLSRGKRVIAFEKDSPVTRKQAKRLQHPNLRVHWGDITRADSVRDAMQEADGVVHLAGIFPPLSESNPALSHAVNVEGTRHILDAMDATGTGRLVFASSIAVYGKQQGKIPPPLKVTDPVAPDDHYGEHKAEGERMISASGTDWTLLRVSACPPANVKSMTSFKEAPIFDNHPDSRMEVIHPADAGLAFANAIDREQSIGKILLLGGGEKNRLTTQQMFNIMAASMGLPPLPREAFQITDNIDFHGDWLDTEESQQLLEFQRYSAEQLYQDFRQSLGIARYGLFAMKPFAPLLQKAILRSSPYYKTQIKNS